MKLHQSSLSPPMSPIWRPHSVTGKIYPVKQGMIAPPNILETYKMHQDASSQTLGLKKNKKTHIYLYLGLSESSVQCTPHPNSNQYNIVQPSIYSNPCPRLFRRTAPFYAPLLPWATIQNWGQPKNDSRNKMHSELCILIYRYS